jgi:hypothetical protein
MYLLWPYLASCDHTLPCQMSLGSIRVTSTLGTILSSRFGPPVSAVTNRSQQAARADLTSQSCSQHATSRAAACTGIWMLEHAGRADRQIVLYLSNGTLYVRLIIHFTLD